MLKGFKVKWARYNFQFSTFKATEYGFKELVSRKVYDITAGV